MNRHQNKLEYLLADAATGRTRVLLTRESDTYIDINDDLHFLSGGKSFVLTSEQNGYNHIYHYDMDGELIRQVTDGPWEVTSLYGIRSEEHTSELQSLMRISYAVFCLKKKNNKCTYHI